MRHALPVTDVCAVWMSLWCLWSPSAQMVELPQESRNIIARKLLQLTLAELFDFRFMQVPYQLFPCAACWYQWGQCWGSADCSHALVVGHQTDPNFGNFLYDARRDTLGLIDFGAAREYSREFVDDYLRLVNSMAARVRGCGAWLKQHVCMCVCVCPRCRCGRLPTTMRRVSSRRQWLWR